MLSSLIRAPVALTVFLLSTPAWAGSTLVAVSPLPDTVSYAAVVEYAVELDADLEQAEVLALTLPGGVFEAVRTDVDRQPHGVYWQGKIHDSWEVLITTHKGKASGLIYTPWQVYELVPDPVEGLRLAELDGERFLPCAHADETDLPQAGPAALPPAALPPTSSALMTIMDVLVVYTPQAETGAGGQSQIESLIQSAVNITNTAYANSQVDARIQLIHMTQAPISDSGSASTDLTNVRTNSVVAGLRNTYGADMVGMIVGDTNACGVGYGQRNPGPGFQGFAYQVTDRTCAVGNLTFAHEFGHNQGCEHDPPTAHRPPMRRIRSRSVTSTLVDTEP